MIFGWSLNQATFLYRGFASLKVFGVPIERVNEWERPYIILAAVYFILLACSIFLSIKKRYFLNLIVSGVMIPAYFTIKIFLHL